MVWKDQGMTEKPRKLPRALSQIVDIHATLSFVAFQSLSGSGLKRPEDGGLPDFISANADVHEIGVALLEALGRCRFVPPEDRAFYDMSKYVKSYADSEAAILRRTGKKTKREAYSGAVWCSVRQADDEIKFCPFRPDKPGTWKQLPDEMIVAIPRTTDPDIVGAALALALERARTFEG